FRFVSTQNRIATAFGETTTPSFALLDLKVGYYYKEKLSVHLGVNNVFDTAYYEHLNRSVRGTTNPIYEPGRNIFTSLSYTF
ncbi:MAG: TonB-dependent receptor, partial [Saprospiraceae bacterium]|nr:TonB-dependent receptor [Saprospiraceae bacterium]